MGSGCGNSIADKVLRLPYNSPLWQHFTRGFLLCSQLSYNTKAKK